MLVSFTFLFPEGYESKWHGVRKSWPIQVAFEPVTFQRLCASLHGCERGKTARASAGLFSWERWRVEVGGGRPEDEAKDEVGGWGKFEGGRFEDGGRTLEARREVEQRGLARPEPET